MMIRTLVVALSVCLVVAASEAQDYGRPFGSAGPYAYVSNNTAESVKFAVCSAVGTFTATVPPGHIAKFQFDPKGGDRTLSVFSAKKRSLLSARQIVLIHNNVYDALPDPAPVAVEDGKAIPSTPVREAPDKGRELKSPPPAEKVVPIAP